MAEWTPPDQNERERIARALETNLLVEAGAGSGKTTAMVGRMIELIRTGTATVEEIAAVTFTRKAATELRERFQLQLEREYRTRATGARAGLETAPLESELLGPEPLDRDSLEPNPIEPGALESYPLGSDFDGPDHLERERFQRALTDLDRCFVGTIHSFCAKLLRERPLEAGVPPNFQEVSGPEEEEFRTESWNRALERLAARDSRMLRRLAELGMRPAQLKGIFTEVADNPDVRYLAPRVAAPDATQLDPVRRQLERLLDVSLSQLPDEEPDAGWDTLQSKVRRLRFSRWNDGWTDPVRFLNALEIAFSSNAVTQNRWPDKDAAKELHADWEDFAAEGGPAQKVYLQWLAHRYPYVLRFARAVAGFYAAERRRAGLLNFQDLLLETARLLRNDREARAELGRRYRRLLIDEFQDTDPIQAEVVFLLAAEPEEDDAWHRATPRPGALFVVGDPKQSIYRFRRADIAVYNQVKARFREFGEVLYLTANFRSTRPVEALVNTVFEGLLPEKETTYQAAFAPLRVVPKDRQQQAVAWYGFEPARGGGGFTGRRIYAPDTALCAAWINERIRKKERRPGDFMILAYRKEVLTEYARALEALDIPVQVTGGSLGIEEDLADLILLLRALGDPENAVLTLAVLVGTHFGLSHEELYGHTRAGGSLAFLQEQPASPVGDALRRLRSFHRMARNLPADAAVAAIIERLGIIPHAAAGDLGATRAGALVYALDAIRQAALDGKTSLAQAVEVLEAALAAEVDAPLIPGETDAVRIMNLHKAKGLEAPVVILAYPARRSEYPPVRHIARASDGTAVGYSLVSDSSRRYGPIIARPLEWEEYAAEEEHFAAAEADRLLYVAATRAEEELIIARCDKTREDSYWNKLHHALDDPAIAGELTITPLAENASRRERLTTTTAEIEERIARIEEARAALGAPSYEAVPVSGRVREVGEEERVAAGVAERVAERVAESVGGKWGTSRAANIDPNDLPPAGDYATTTPSGRGTEWGTIVHRALQLSTGGSVDDIRAICHSILTEAERPLTEHGEPTELDELISLVTAFHASPLWQRARAAETVLVEVPFAISFSPEDAARLAIPMGGGAKGAEHAGAAPVATWPTPPRQIVEGVIDLAFRSPDGTWTIADYKTDIFKSDEVRHARTALYRRQVDLYALCWTRLTGEPVTERVLVFTGEGREERW